MQLSTTPLEVTYLRTTSLKPDPRNPRVHSDKQVRQIAQSIESFGFNVPLLIDDEQKVIAGHGRLQAARKLGWDTVPAIRLSHLTESQRMAFLIFRHKDSLQKRMPVKPNAKQIENFALKIIRPRPHRSDRLNRRAPAVQPNFQTNSFFSGDR